MTWHALTPEEDPATVCVTCGGSGCDPDDFDQIDPVLGDLRACPDCDGRGETY